MSLPLYQRVAKRVIPKTFSRLDDLNTRAGIMFETFITEQYKWLVTGIRANTTAIDLGANMGDSAIYLAQQPKIRKVLSYELYPYWFNVAKQNISQNPNMAKVQLFNKGVGIPGRIQLPENKHYGSTGKLVDHKYGREVEIVSLNQIIGGKRNLIVKCDVEGSEYQIFVPGVDLSNVYRMQIEYEYDPKKIIEPIKKQGFKVLRKEWGEMTDANDHEFGWLYAWK